MRFITLTLFILSLSSAYAGEKKFRYSSGGTNRRGGNTIPVTGGPRATSPEVTAMIEPLKESNANDHESEGTQRGGLRGEPKPAMPTIQQHEPGYHEAMKEYVQELKVWEKKNPGST
jgi:hypothetical protein